MTLYFNSKDKYNNYMESLFNNTEFKKHQSKTGTPYYTYKQFVIDVKFDVGEEDETCISDTFEPFYKHPQNQYIGGQSPIAKGFLNNIQEIQYDRPLILLDYKNDLIKYKNEIIKYIDYELYENDDLTPEEIQNEMKKYDKVYNKLLSICIKGMKTTKSNTVELNIGNYIITLINEKKFNYHIDLAAKLLNRICFSDGIFFNRIKIPKYTLQDIINLKIGGELITDLKEYNLIINKQESERFSKLMDKYDFEPFNSYQTYKKFYGHVLSLPFDIYKTELIDLIKNICVFNNTIIKYNKPQEIYKSMKPELNYIDRIILNSMPEHNVIIEFNYEQAKKDIENLLFDIRYHTYD